MTWMHMAWIVLSHISLLNSVLRHMTWYHEVYVLTLLIVGVLTHTWNDAYDLMTWMMHMIWWLEWCIWSDNLNDAYDLMTWMLHMIWWHEWYDLMTWIVQISRGKKHMTSNSVLGVLTIFCTEDRNFRMETEGGSLIPHYVCFLLTLI